jgi:hypothetical protein
MLLSAQSIQAKHYLALLEAPGRLQPIFISGIIGQFTSSIQCQSTGASTMLLSPQPKEAGFFILNKRELSFHFILYNKLAIDRFYLYYNSRSFICLVDWRIP